VYAVCRTALRRCLPDITRTVRYIERNPLPYGLPIQQHDFVDACDGWNLRAAAR